MGTWPAFNKIFVDDEDGNFDPLSVAKTLEAVGFSGVVVPDHVPSVVDDTD